MMLKLHRLPDFSVSPSRYAFKRESYPYLTLKKNYHILAFPTTLVQLLEEVLKESIFTKNEEAEQKLSQEEAFIHTLKQSIPQGEWWLDWILGRTPDTRWFWSHFQENKEELYEKVMMANKAFTALPSEGEFERLPFFSQRISGNPHYFDSNGPEEKILLHWMYVDQVLRGNTDVVMPKTTGEKNDLLAEYGIMKDDLWNFVTCQGLLAANDSKIHPVWQAAVSTKTVMNVPMKELTKMKRIWPAIGAKVWIVENSSVSSTIMDAVQGAPIVCTHGQLRLAGWQLLDRLVQSNCTLYYSGDLDPEGLVIADRLKQRYKEHLVLWRMNREAYEESVSNEDIADRLSKLDRITTPEFNDLISLMRNIKMAGYQEAIVEHLIRDIMGHGDRD